jgi:signal peptidase I
VTNDFTPNRGYITPTPFVYDRYEISDITYYNKQSTPGNEVHVAHMTDEAYEKLKNNATVLKITKQEFPKNENSSTTFPLTGNQNWTVDNFGPIYIPKKGVTVLLTPESVPLYERIIEVYEGSEFGIDNKITVEGTVVSINGKPTTEYTFKQDYYWMMGDNRHNSQDARSWGYVPFTHVMGKPVMVWFSLDAHKQGGFFKRIRWDRMFTTVGGNGPLVSYRYVVLALILLYFGWGYFKGKRKAKA